MGNQNNETQGSWQDGGRVGTRNHLSPPTYLDKFQTILNMNTYQFTLRFNGRTAERLQ